MRRWRFGFASALAVLVSRGAAADPPPPAERAQVYSPYEIETIAIALASVHGHLDPYPEGKIVERVDVVPLEVIERRDPAPRFLNIFHVTTQKDVVRRELLLREGEPYRQVLADDTVRNLRRLPELSLVLVVATAGSAPDRVGIVVITKDVWSLRAGWNVVGTPGGVELFDIAPTETNLFGTHQTVVAEYIYEPLAHTFGLGYTIPRVAGSRVAAIASAHVSFDRVKRAFDGSYGSFIVGQPLYSGRTPWAWDSTVAWEDLLIRRYQNAVLATYVDPNNGGKLPFEYRHRQFRAVYDLTRSFGWDTKQDFTLTAGVTRNVYRTDFPGSNPQTVADFRSTQVPVSDTRVGPTLRYHLYANRYLRIIDFETLALQEDFRLGPDLVLSAMPSFRTLGSTRDVVDLYAAAQYTAPMRDGLARVFVITDNQLASGRVSDGFVNPGVHIATPTIAGIGRIVAHGTLTYRYRNYLNTFETLGGSTQLRGFPTNFFRGKDLVTYNVEARTRPFEILSCELAAVAFYDAGDAFDGFSGPQRLVPYQSVGFGVRILFPQLDRIVFRTDVGFPIERPIDVSTNRPIAPYAFVVTFAQAFDVPSIDPQPVLPTGATETVPTTTAF
jgi:hypothetical protein